MLPIGGLWLDQLDVKSSVEVLQPVGVFISAGSDQSNKNGGLVEDQSAVQVTSAKTTQGILSANSSWLSPK
jgi:hypothetical protein